MSKQSEIKALRLRLKELQAHKVGIKQNISTLSKDLYSVDQEISAAQYKLDSLLGKDSILVSDHALMRYCERVLNIDMEEVRDKILSESALDLLDKLKAGDGQYPVKEGGFKFTLKNKVVTTILT